MTRFRTLLRALPAALACALNAACAASNHAADTAPAGVNVRIGTYDSRAVALSYYRSSLFNRRLDARIAEAEAAKRKEDKARVEEIEASEKARQHLGHMQVFGNAPIPDILKDLEETLRAEAATRGLALIVRDVDLAYRGDAVDAIDITEALVMHFSPSAQTHTMVKDLATHPPLPLEQFPIECGGGEEGTPAAKPPSAERSGQVCAEAWVRLVDQEMYAGSWEKTSTHFRAVVPMKKWIEDIEPLRAGLGKVRSRTLKSCRYTTALPDAPKGRYVLAEFETSFQRKEKAIETITSVLDADGCWRVDGYYVH